MNQAERMEIENRLERACESEQIERSEEEWLAFVAWATTSNALPPNGMNSYLRMRWVGFRAGYRIGKEAV